MKMTQPWSLEETVQSQAAEATEKNTHGQNATAGKVFLKLHLNNQIREVFMKQNWNRKFEAKNWETHSYPAMMQREEHSWLWEAAPCQAAPVQNATPASHPSHGPPIYISCDL